MKIEDFWNQAFIAALSRLPPEEAKGNADLATQLCIEHWHANRNHTATPRRVAWKDEDISEVYLSGIASDGTHISFPPSANQTLATSRASLSD